MNTIVASSGAVTSISLPSTYAHSGGVMPMRSSWQSSHQNRMSFDVNASPLDQRMPFRRRNVTVRPSSEYAQDSATPGMMSSASGVHRVSG